MVDGILVKKDGMKQRVRETKRGELWMGKEEEK